MFSAKLPEPTALETMDWPGQQQAQRERIEFYDRQVRACIQRLEEEFCRQPAQSMAVWQQVKLHYIGLMVDHLQPELAEGFFNSVTTKILHRTQFPERLHASCVRLSAPNTWKILRRVPYHLPRPITWQPRAQLEGTLQTLFENNCSCNAALKTCSATCICWPSAYARLAGLTLRANFQLRVLSGLFYPQQGGLPGRQIITGYTELPLAIPILHGEQEQLIVHAALFGGTTCMRCSALRAPTSWWIWKCPAPIMELFCATSCRASPGGNL